MSLGFYPLSSSSVSSGSPLSVAFFATVEANIAVSASAEGIAAVVSEACSAEVQLAASADGYINVEGVVRDYLPLLASGSGHQCSGVVVEVISLAADATGIGHVTGSADGVFALFVEASAEQKTTGQGSALLTLSGSATGFLATFGQVSAQIGVSSQGVGGSQTGIVSAVFRLAGVGTGRVGRSGSGAATIRILGLANGALGNSGDLDVVLPLQSTALGSHLAAVSGQAEVPVSLSAVGHGEIPKRGLWNATSLFVTTRAQRIEVGSHGLG